MCDLLINGLKKHITSNLLTDRILGLRSLSSALLRKKGIIGTQERNTESGANVKKTEQMARQELITILRIKEMDALKMIWSHRELLQTPSLMISRNCDICLCYKLSKQTISNNPFLLYEKELTKKLDILLKLPFGLNHVISLVKLPMAKLRYISQNVEETVEEINTLCKLFDITTKEVCEIVSKTPFLLLKSPQELEQRFKLFCDFGFQKTDVLNDMWIFKYSESFIEKRLNIIREYNPSHLKTWMIRCPEEILYKHIKRESENRDILGENSIVQYLSEKLNCGENISKSIIRKHPQLQNKSLRRITFMIDLLFSQGFTSTQICRTPKILLHSIKTTEERLKQMELLGKKAGDLYMLTKSQKQYQQYIENLMKGKLKFE